MISPLTLIVGALSEETAPLTARLEARRRLPSPPGTRLWSGRLNGSRVAVGWTGDGPIRAAAGLAAFIERVRPKRVFGIGLAGALSTNLCVGDLVVGREIIDPSGARFEAPPVLLELCDTPRDSHLGIRRDSRLGVLLSASRIAVTAADKSTLLAGLGHPAVAAVDLESAAWTRVASEQRIDALMVRAISDRADETLALDFNRFTGHDGSLERHKVVAFVALRPWNIRRLWHLRERALGCAERLREWLSPRLANN